MLAIPRRGEPVMARPQRISNSYAITVEAYRSVAMGGAALVDRAVVGLLETVPTATMIMITVVDPGEPGDD